MMTSTKPTLVNGTEVHMAVSNDLMANDIRAEEHELLAFLRKELGNSKVSLVCDVNQQAVGKRAFTAAEKLDEMIQANKALGTLVVELGLDLE